MIEHSTTHSFAILLFCLTVSVSEPGEMITATSASSVKRLDCEYERHISYHPSRGYVKLRACFEGF